MLQTIIFAAILSFATSATLDHLYLPAKQQLGSTNPSLYSPVQSYSSSSNQIPILRFLADNNGDGTYRYAYETANKISAEEQGDAKDGTKARGSFSYSSPEGEQVSITYTADENGFLPQGSHIPTAPPIPEAILKSLEFNAAAEAKGIFNEGSYRGEVLQEEKYRHQGQGAEGYSSRGGYRY